jgi:hypothetical protein
MTKVNAYQIVERIEWMQFTFGEERQDTALVLSKEGKKRAVEDINGETWDVGDWVVLWPSGYKTVHKPDYFENHFVPMGGIRYETKLS